MFIYLTSKFVTWHHAPTWNSHFCWLVPKIDDQKHWRSSVNKLTTLNPCWSISKLNSIDPRPSYWSWPWPRYYAEHAFVCFVQLLNFHELIFWHLIFWFFIWFFHCFNRIFDFLCTIRIYLKDVHNKRINYSHCTMSPTHWFQLFFQCFKHHSHANASNASDRMIRALSKSDTVHEWPIDRLHIQF